MAWDEGLAQRIRELLDEQPGLSEKRMFGGLAFLVGVIVAHIKRDEAPPWLRTHLTYQIRTFWIGLLWSLAGVLTAWLLIGFLFLAWSFVFVLVRTVKGFLRLNDDRPIENPESWTFG